jgi:hypothetical protein
MPMVQSSREVDWYQWSNDKLFFALTLGWLSFLVPIYLPAQTKVFRNSYVAFEMPDHFDCNLEHTEWVCRSKDPKTQRESMFILTAKEVGPSDSMEQYRAHLSQPQPTSHKPDGKAQMSRVVYPPKPIKVNDHEWIDGLHMNSEVPGYYTRYIATVRDQIAILVTLSAHREHYSKYSPQFFRTVNSLRIIASRSLTENITGSGEVRGATETLGGPVSASLPLDLLALEAESQSAVGSDGSKGGLRNLFLGLALILLGLGAYIYLKSRKK